MKQSCQWIWGLILVLRMFGIQVHGGGSMINYAMMLLQCCWFIIAIMERLREVDLESIFECVGDQNPVLSVLHCLEYRWKKTFLIWIWHLLLRFLSKIDSCYFLVWFTRVWRCLNSHESYLVYQKGEQPHIGNSINVGTAQQKVAKTRHKKPRFDWNALFVMWPKLCTRTPQFHWKGLFVRQPKLGRRL